MKTIIAHTFSLLNAEQKSKGAMIVMLLVFQSFLDFFTIASFLPVIFLIINPGFIESNAILHSVYTYFEFVSPGNFIVAITLLVLLFTIAKALVSYWINLVKARYVFGIATELSSRALSRYLATEYPGFSEADFSKEVTRISNYPITFANSLILPITNLLSEALIFIFILICIVLYDIKIVLLLAVILLPVGLWYQLLKKNTKTISQSIKEKYPLSLKYAQQLVEALIEIKISHKENFFSRRFTKVSEDLSRVFAMDHVIQNSMVRLTEVIAAIVICVLVIYTALSGQSYQQSILMLSIYAGASFRIIPSLNRIFLASFQIRSHEFLIHELKDLVNFRFSSEVKTKTEHLVFSKTLELKNISFEYSENNPVLQNVNFTLVKGTKVALTGKSGEGKTTLLLILLGFLKNYKGEILLDGATISEGFIQNMIGYVPQNPYILDGSILENIAFGDSPENMDREKALRLLNELELSNLIKQLPNGIDTPIGERGVKLSGGQRQRLAIARALYADADILLLDEVTNQLNTTIELDILNLLDRFAAQKKTIVMVTHKIVRQDFFDAIYTLENGTLQNSAAQV